MYALGVTFLLRVRRIRLSPNGPVDDAMSQQLAEITYLAG